jgi:nitrite reductase (NO-forming)
MGKIIIGVVLVAAVVGFLLMRDNPKAAEEMMHDSMDDMKGEVMEAGEKVMQKGEQMVGKALEDAKKRNAPVKEVVMTSFYDDKGAWFSVKEIKVKQGDIVRVKVTNTKGMHDWVLDEFDIKEETPLNEEVVIEFVADKAGTYEYYCSKPGHRAKGQVGKLIVE